MKTKKKTIVPRNPYVAAALLRKAGSHEETTKTKRQQAKRKLQLLLRDHAHKEDMDIEN